MAPSTGKPKRPDLGHIAKSLRTLAVPIESLSADPSNVNTHPDRSIDAIAASLKLFGQQKPIVADAKGIVRAGNGTLEAARRLGWTHLAVNTTDLSGPDATAYSIADNRSASFAEWDEAGLLSMLKSLDEFTPDDLGFNSDEISAMLASIGGGEVASPDDFPEVDENIETAHTCPKCGYQWSGGK